MRKLYLYFSGTGNTKYVVQKFVELSKEKNPIVQSIEHHDYDYQTAITQAQDITIAYPIYGSLMPRIMEDFLLKHKDLFTNKNITIIATQMLFSGDGAALAYRILKPYHIHLMHTIHINMPNNITDVQFLHPKSVQETTSIIEKADQKTIKIVDNIQQGKTYKTGRRWYSRFIGYFFQRIYFNRIHKSLEKRLKINHKLCITCNKCVILCPVKNLNIVNDRVITYKNCTLCYRCINSCPTKAISLLTKKAPSIQYIRKDFN